MCGIVGILARSCRVSEDLLERATKSLAHRGPDHSGTTIIRETVPQPLEIGLGNRRLAILDLSPLGHQPMRDPETGNWIVYNGEIYNFREIRQELEKHGVHFTSQSDTEVLLKAYGRWSEGCLKELRGMFAFAIWDARHHRLFLARDPLGIKPLYYFASAQNFLFGSEVRTLLTTGLVPRRLDSAGLVNYLAFGSAYDPITMIEGISALKPGHYLVWENGAFREEMYWDLVAIDSGEHAHRDQAFLSQQERNHLEKELGDELYEAVRLHLVSDVPVGVFLSGGIDSSSLVSILSSGRTASSKTGFCGTGLHTFSIVFREANFDESEYSRAVARRFGTDHHEISVSQQDALDSIPGALAAMDQPTIDGVNTYLVSRETRSAGMKVALSGLGGDEMFAGYSSFRTVPRMERFASFWQHVPWVARQPLGSIFASIASSNDQNRKLAALAHENGNLLHPYFLSRMLFTPPERDHLLTHPDAEALGRANASLKENLRRTNSLDPINRVSYLEARCYMLNTLLRDSDFMSMAHGLEVRVPLLDHHLARKVLALPGPWKMNGIPKPLLVRAVGNTLPNQIVRRRKRGFTLPFEHWLRDELRAGVEANLRKIPAGPLGMLLNDKGVRDVWKNFLCGTTSWSRPWSLYVLQRWCELHL